MTGRTLESFTETEKALGDHKTRFSSTREAMFFGLRVANITNLSDKLDSI
jgi:hypothetical protein